MSVEVGLASQTHGAVRHGCCALCGRPWESAGASWRLHLGRACWGEVCLCCVEAGPGPVAVLLRRRAAVTRRLAERCRPCLLAWGWTGLQQVLHEYAATLEGLADVLTGRTAW
jgi:hypothetical protein